MLEDNLRVPSGVSYMLENRKMMMRLFPELFATQLDPRRSQHYPDLLLEILRGVAPAGVNDPTVAVLTPGPYNSAYFEHAFLAQQMGVELVEGQDLFVAGRHGVHAHHARAAAGACDLPADRRRFPRSARVPDGFAARRAWPLWRLSRGRVTLANAIGTGVADDKSIYPYVPAMVRFYLDEEPILNNVPTYMLYKPEDRSYVLEHLADLVVKEVHGAGGYGMLIGPDVDRRGAPGIP